MAGTYIILRTFTVERSSQGGGSSALACHTRSSNSLAYYCTENLVMFDSSFCFLRVWA